MKTTIDELLAFAAVVDTGSITAAAEQLAHVDGAMLGRVAYHEPAQLGRADRLFFDPAAPEVDAFDAVEAYRPYMAAQLARGVHLAAMTRHMLGLMHGRPGARAWRRILTVESIRPGAGLEVLEQALGAVREASARRDAAA